MGKISGSDWGFWFDGVQVSVTSVNENAVNEIKDATNTSTAAQCKTYAKGRQERTLTVEGFLFGPDGAEMSSGDLIKGQFYRVTLGTIVETSGSYVVGEIFESDGTGTASENNKVRPLGALCDGNDMNLKINDTQFAPVSEFEFSKKFDTKDTTTISTTAYMKEFATTRAEHDIKFKAFLDSMSADLFGSDPLVEDVEFSFSANNKMSGVALIAEKAKSRSVEDYVVVEYSGKINGFPVETNLGLPCGVLKAVKIIDYKGATSNKETLGNGIIVSKTVQGNVNDFVKVSYEIKISGAVTENVAN